MAAEFPTRWMLQRDLPAVLDVEERCYANPWSQRDFVDQLRQQNVLGMVAELQQQIVGFFLFELHRNRLHVLNFAVHPDYQRRGIGKAQFQKLVSKLSPDTMRRNRIMLEVRETNLGAQLFFRSMGFRAVSLLQDYYEDTPESAYLMQYRHVATPAREVRHAGN